MADARNQDQAPRARVGALTVGVATLADPLHETAERRDPYEKTHAAHNSWDWYAAYMSARENGRTPKEAFDAAGRYMEEVLHVLPR
jgi:hypothetical protein